MSEKNFCRFCGRTLEIVRDTSAIARGIYRECPRYRRTMKEQHDSWRVTDDRVSPSFDAVTGARL